jgi:hypothetical protein
MNDTSNQTNAGSNGNSQQEQSRQERGRRFFEDLSTAVRRGAEDARRAAEEAIPKVKTAAADAAYWTAYGVSFAAVFEWTVLKQITPDCVKTGCNDGVRAGREAAQNWFNRMRQPKSQPATPPPSSGPAGESAKPGVA